MKFFHTADIHFGVENYGRVDAKTGIHTRLLDFVKSLTTIVDQAIEQNIDFFLFSGDAYKTAHPTPTQQKFFMQLMMRLQQAGIPVVIIVGNHDHPLSFGKAHALDVFDCLRSDNFHVFSKPELKIIQTKNGPVQIVGIPWPSRNHLVAHQEHRMKDNSQVADYLSARIGELIASFAQEVDEKVPTVLAGHLTVSTGIFSGSEKCAIYGTDPIFLPSQLALEQFDYVALGHLHRHQNLNPGGKTPVVYAGSIERVDFGERREEKGFCSVEIKMNKKGVKSCEYEFVQLQTRPMIQVDVTLEKGTDQTEKILAALAHHKLDNAIVKIRYHLKDGVSDKVDLNEILRACANAMYVVGVIPVHEQVQRERRMSLQSEMKFETLLEQYFSSKKELIERKDILKNKAEQLYQISQESE
ncbi:MAG: exonuclease SbcCD subunit D [Epsilonproteobacteria bacterium]|nr:exonuclease SbcCD subunit D [Campylobacterota bacterium]